MVKAVLTGFSTSLALRSGILCGQQAVIGNLGRIRPNRRIKPLSGRFNSPIKFSLPQSFQFRYFYWCSVHPNTATNSKSTTLFMKPWGPLSKYFYLLATSITKEVWKTAGLICSRLRPPELQACPTVDKILALHDLSILVSWQSYHGYSLSREEYFLGLQR